MNYQWRLPVGLDYLSQPAAVEWFCSGLQSRIEAPFTVRIPCDLSDGISDGIAFLGLGKFQINQQLTALVDNRVRVSFLLEIFSSAVNCDDKALILQGFIFFCVTTARVTPAASNAMWIIVSVLFPRLLILGERIVWIIYLDAVSVSERIGVNDQVRVTCDRGVEQDAFHARC